MGITGSNLGLQNYLNDKKQWDYYQAHKDECVPGPDGSMPDFCSAKDPGPPPLDQVIKTDRGEVHTHLTLDEHDKVIREESTVTYDGKTYHSVTDYSNGGNTIVTNTSYPDGSTVKNETYLDPDNGSGTMYTRGSDGSWSNYHRGPKGPDGKPAEWIWDSGSKNPNDDGTDGDTTGGGAPDHPPSPGGGSGHGTSIKM
jgi:hypothetical protein